VLAESRGLGEGDSQGERKMGEGIFLPPFFKSFSPLVGEFRSQACGVEIMFQ